MNLKSAVGNFLRGKYVIPNANEKESRKVWKEKKIGNFTTTVKLCIRGQRQWKSKEECKLTYPKLKAEAEKILLAQVPFY